MSNQPYIGASQRDEHRKENNAKAVDNYVWDVTNLQWVRANGTSNGAAIVESPLPTEGNNPSTVLSYDGNGDLQYIDETINGTTYRTTLTYSSRVLVGISAAVEQ